MILTDFTEDILLKDEIVITDFTEAIIVKDEISKYYNYNIVNKFCGPMIKQVGEDIVSDINKFIKEHAEYN